MSKVRELNLLPQHIKSQKDGQDKIGKIIAGGVIVCCAVGGLAIYMNMQVSDLEKEKARLNQEIAKTEERVQENNKLNEKIGELQGRIEKIDALSVLKKKNTKEALSQFGKKVPRGVTVKDLNFVNTEEDVRDGYLGSIKLSGESRNRSDIEEFWANLREDNRYYISHVSGIQKAEGKDRAPDMYTFSLELKVKEK